LCASLLARAGGAGLATVLARAGGAGLATVGLALPGDATLGAQNIARMSLKGGAQGIAVPPGHPGLSGAVGLTRGAGVEAGTAAVYNSIAGVGRETIELGLTGPRIATSVAGLSAKTLTHAGADSSVG
jgi:hypothetical protein